ncbi:sugar transporter, putative [Talaromyces stipitatus ATCC 10500]|uniref:Sugar transporter, putative n=1 Tax=Talaromyces stipitatus (strain ATCC 10500 / CBS 375.48 / QM 6759 / NRRL 1006) TaxID=441959 RepID=B8LUT7_TALSN|nr:sugar transporter, putative [Talaromyces stipitatus ATCC 10500]EED24029.1 sugar transporter, putative [Talaromyces stipitatus ATCC 10500]
MVFDQLRGRRLSLVVGLVGAMGFMLQGYDQAVANGLLTLNSFVRTFPAIDVIHATGAEKSHKSTIQGTTIAIYEVGCALGALSCAYLGDKLGRRRTIFLAGCIACVGIIIQASPFTLAQFIVARVITGLGVGGFTAVVPMYISESSRAENRGRMVLLEGFFAIGGIVVASWLEFGLYYVQDNDVSWRFPIAFQLIFAIIVTSCILFLPESPRWLVSKNRVEEAAVVLGRLEDTDGDSEAVALGLDTIQHSLQDESGSERSHNPFAFNETRNFHRTCLAIGVNILAQMSGINIITFYSDTIFQTDLGYTGTTSRIISGCLQIWQFICAGIAVYLIDRVGRRRLLISAALGMAISQACLAGLSSVITTNKSAASASLLFYFLAFTFFPIGLFLVPFMYAAEIAPLQTRGKVTAMSASANWLFNFLIAEVTPTGFDNIGWKYYLIYLCINASSFVIFCLFYPETKGRSLEEIDEIFIRSKSPFETVRIAKELPFQIDVLATADEKILDEHIEKV